MSWGQVWGLSKCGFLCLQDLGSAETGVYPGLGYSGASSILWTCPVEQGSTRAYPLASDWPRQGPVAAVSVTVPLPSLTPFLLASHVGGGQHPLWGTMGRLGHCFLVGKVLDPRRTGAPPSPASFPGASEEAASQPLPLLAHSPASRDAAQEQGSRQKLCGPESLPQPPGFLSSKRPPCLGSPPLRSTCPHPRAGFELLKPNGYEGRGRSERPQPHLLRFLVARAPALYLTVGGSGTRPVQYDLPPPNSASGQTASSWRSAQRWAWRAWEEVAAPTLCLCISQGSGVTWIESCLGQGKGPAGTNPQILSRDRVGLLGPAEWGGCGSSVVRSLPPNPIRTLWVPWGA